MSMRKSFEAFPHRSVQGGSRKNLQDLVPTYDDDGSLDADIMKSGKVSFFRLAVAIEKNDIMELQVLLAFTVYKLELKDSLTGTSLLHVAAKHRDLALWGTLKESEVFTMLLDSKDKRGTTPLIAAVWYDNYTAVLFLLSEGADTNPIMWESKKSCLHMAAELLRDEICKEIVKYNRKKAFINSVDSEGNTPVMIAIIHNSPSVFVLLQAGSDLLKKNLKTGRNIMHMAIVHSRHTIVEHLIKRFPQEELLDTTDVNGHSPLQLAIRLCDVSSVTQLLTSPFAIKLIGRCQNMLHYLVTKNRPDIFEEILDRQPDRTFFNVIDSKGRTVFIHAVELCLWGMVDLLIINGIDFRIRNYYSGETVLHAAAYTNDDKMLDLILGIHRIEEIFEVGDYNGIIPYELVLGKVGYRVWIKFFLTGYITREFYNENHESSLFISVKEGNYFLMRCLLLSDKFHNYCSDIYDTSESEILTLELQGKIFPSDVYIMTNMELATRRWKKSPNLGILFEHNYQGQNIFHACALGENNECIRFMYNYCTLFNESALKDFDAPDRFGNTPFAFAVVSGSVENSKFFMSKGASLAHANAVGQTPLDAMHVKLPHFQDMFMEVINECAVVDSHQRKVGTTQGDIVINYDFLFPRGQMDVISFIHQKLRGRDNIEILKSVVIEYFVLYKWSRIKDVIGMRFFMNAIKVIAFSTYLTFTLCMFLQLNDVALTVYWWVTFLVSMLNLLFTLPIIFMRNTFYFLLVFSGPILTIIYLLTKTQDRATLEIGAFAILFSWFSVLIQGYASDISFQISMYFEVIKSVVPHLPLVVLVLFAFSHCFFTLFHDFIQFNNPFHSFICTASILMERENLIPTFMSDEPAIHRTNDMYTVRNPATQTIDGHKELRNVIIEGSILLTYDVLICICILNMLVGLAVRSGEELEQGGKIHRIRIYVEDLKAWEHFVDTKVYRVLTKCRVSWLFGFPRSLKKKLTVPTIYHPLSEPPVEEFDLHKLKYVAVDWEMIKPDELNSLKFLLDQEHGSGKKERLRRGSKAAGNIPWVYG